MKKRWMIIAILVLIVLFVPIPSGVYKDGGTRVYSALTYKIVKWRRLNEDFDRHENTRIYFGLDAYRSLDELWEKEMPYVKHSFVGEIKELHGENVIVEPMDWEEEWNSYKRISFRKERMEDGEFEVGNLVQVVYKGGIRESDPAGIDLVSCEIAKDLRHLQYCDIWLSEDAEEVEGLREADLIISQIYSNCFFATPVLPSPIVYKINGELPEKWCVGDKVFVRFTDTKYDDAKRRMEVDLHEIKESTFEPDPDKCYKPVIYLYPEQTTDVSVKLMLNGKLTCTYPAYGNGWNVTAKPDGTLTDKKGQTYNYLYWEGITDMEYDFTKGFCIRGEDTAAFLEDALAKLGLNRREANEFIVYWLPMMQENPYNVIAFQTDAYTEAAKLSVKPEPDTVIRIFMTWKASDKQIDITKQNLSAPKRTGFTVVEWGGTEIK